MQLIPGWHPLIVHFPLALIITATLVLSAARVLPGQRLAATLATVGTWNLCLGAVTVFLALGTGLAAVIGLQIDAAAHQAIAAHVKSAVVTTILVVLVAVWRGAGTDAASRPTWAFLLMLWAATGALTVTGYRGGQNVYRHGIGVRDRYPNAAAVRQLHRSSACAAAVPVLPVATPRGYLSASVQRRVRERPA